MVIIVAWNLGEFPLFIANNPIHCLIASIRGTGSHDEVILIINDIEKIPFDYVLLLEKMGVQIYVLNNMLSIISSIYPALNVFNFNEKACFVRWLLIEDYLNNFKSYIKDVLVVDGDVLFLMSSSKIREAFSGRTFILQSCPAFTFLTDPLVWLQQYHSALDLLNDDLNGFSQKLLAYVEKMRGQNNQRDQIKRSINYPYRFPLASDQDFINALIVNNLLRQNSFIDLQMLHKLAMTDNPIGFFDHFIESGLTSPIKFKLISNKKIPLILYANDYSVTHLHFQSGFAHYCTALFAYFNDVKKGFVKPPLRVTYPYEKCRPSDQYNYTGGSLSRLQLYINIKKIQSLIRMGWMSVMYQMNYRIDIFHQFRLTFLWKIYLILRHGGKRVLNFTGWINIRRRYDTSM